MESSGYFKYIQDHVANVQRAWHEQLRPAILAVDNFAGVVDIVDNLVEVHDSSKYSAEEFEPYNRYFYEGQSENESEIDTAWLIHQNTNKHHWQYWILIPDDSGSVGVDVIQPLDMPLEYICEMLCDWHSFSAKSESTAYSWYHNRGRSMILSQNTREAVEYLIQFLKTPLGA